jgi:hypothetical protein
MKISKAINTTKIGRKLQSSGRRIAKNNGIELEMEVCVGESEHATDLASVDEDGRADNVYACECKNLTWPDLDSKNFAATINMKETLLRSDCFLLAALDVKWKFMLMSYQPHPDPNEQITLAQAFYLSNKSSLNKFDIIIVEIDLNNDNVVNQYGINIHATR